MVFFDGSDLSIVSIIPFNNTLYVLAQIGSWSKQYNVYAVPCDDPSNYTIIKKNFTINSEYIGMCSRGWLFIEDNWEFSLKAFDFVKGELITLGKECGYTSHVKLHVWSKSSPVYHPYGFCVIGDFVYYRKGASDNQKIMRVSLSDPSQVQLMD